MNVPEEREERPAPKEPGIGREELEHTVSLLTMPIDYAGLIQSGVLERIGPWFKVNDWDRLPEHARAQISNWQSGAAMLVKFRKPTRRLGPPPDPQ